ncbi:HpcH/HpaI aldolase family protein [Salinarimonas ramus]|uniref:2,4-dihydroxyhept-2-ene-1,7-dioic acid aldolase n=1 Tax=Salinarimonas ramus TaxID=690164 RepID=A0A917Q531_9HYPH|nr:aldolase/citrate lyase family protein [Salinarimonas ramus]GGK24474.1 2,4-dihydroxyhept-2-ene-1,7-dioic acid aldolase [Salinarimonas ramus]
MSATFRLAERLAENRPLVSAWCGMPTPETAGLLAAEAFDAVTLDMQHGAIDFREVLQAIPLVAAHGKPTVVRVPVGAFATASRVLDAGAAGIIAPMINSVADARALVAYTKFPPVGERSWGPAGALALNGLQPPQYFQRANDAVMVLAMVETRAALDIVDEILAVDGLDGIFIGPADLSITLSGGAGVNPAAPEVDEALDHALARTRAAGKRIGVYAHIPERAALFKSKGFDFVAASSDANFMRAGARALLGGLAG